MKFALLGSGSEGNGLVVEAASNDASVATRILIDCGFTLRETEQRLARLGLTPNDLTAIVLTHEHDDHASGAFRLARRYKIPLWATRGTLRGCARYFCDGVEVNLFGSHQSFKLNHVLLQPIAVPHDAMEPTQFVLSDGQRRFGLLTDVGMITPHIIHCLSNVDALVLEFNHDKELLRISDYPYRLKQRIGGAYGHLSNCEAKKILQAIDQSRLQHLVAAHLSQSNNTPDLVLSTLSEALSQSPRQVEVACQHEGLGWRQIQ